jgi:hypothetical protein
MRSRLAMSALVVASLFGATAIAALEGAVSVTSGSNGGNCMGGLATLWMIHQPCLGSTAS